MSLIWFISILFVCSNLFCTIVNLRIKCVTETKNVSVLFYKNLISSFSTWLTHLNLRFLYILGCTGPWWGNADRQNEPASQQNSVSHLLWKTRFAFNSSSKSNCPRNCPRMSTKLSKKLSTEIIHESVHEIFYKTVNEKKSQHLFTNTTTTKIFLVRISWASYLILILSLN